MNRELPNFRDLGNRVSPEGNQTGRARYYRSASLHNLDKHGIETLKKIGINTIIDLRSALEARETDYPLSRSDSIIYHNVPIYQAMDSSLIPSNNLTHTYTRSLTDCKVEIAEVFHLLAEHGEGGVIFHCASGKDRTGLISALLLSLAEIEIDQIVEDYMLSLTYCRNLIDTLQKKPSVTPDELARWKRLLTVDPNAMRFMLEFCEKVFGTASTYLEYTGVSILTQRKIRETLLDCRS